MRLSHPAAIAVSLAIAVCGSASVRSATGAEPRVSTRNQAVTRKVSTTRQESVLPKPQELPVPSAEAEAVIWADDPMIDDCGGCGECLTCESCSPYADGYWAEFDLLVWWRDSRNFPALVTTLPNDGILPGATVLFGGDVDEHAQPGGRVEAGLWLDPCEVVGLGVRYLALGDAPVRFALSSDELDFFARPYTAVSPAIPPTPTRFPVADPPSTGNLALQTDSNVQAGDFFVRWALSKSCCYQVDLLAGYQFSRIDEDLVIASTTVTPVGNDTQSISITDRFDAQNEFHGGHFGLQGEYRRGCWGLEMLTRFGFGNMRQSVFIAGETTAVDADGNEDVREGFGLLAQTFTNGGLHEQNRFSYVQDAGFKLVYYPVERMKLSLGYTVMYWSSVARPGSHIDTTVDNRLLTAPPPPTPPSGVARPAFAFRPTDFYLHGLNLGLEVSF